MRRSFIIPSECVLPQLRQQTYNLNPIALTGAVIFINFEEALIPYTNIPCKEYMLAKLGIDYKFRIDFTAGSVF